jgi:hypothetical protein
MPLTYSGLQNSAVGILAKLPVKPRLNVMSRSCGLFSDLLMAINGVQFAEKHGLAGEIHWDKRSLYFDPERGGNAHAYFFENSKFDFSKARGWGSYSFPYFPSAKNFEAPEGIRPRNALKKLFDSYAAPRREIWDEVERFHAERLSAPAVLGIQLRRTDAVQGFEGRKVQPVENFVAAARDWLVKNEGGIIFLATDAVDVTDDFVTQFGERVVFQNALRSEDGTPLHGHLDGGIAGSPYRNGREALVDALILSKCDFLIRSFSFLTAYSLCINLDLEFLDLDRLNMRVTRIP